MRENQENILTRSLTEIQTAKYIGMSRSYLRRARVYGNRDSSIPAPPFIKIGRAVRYLREDLDAWLDNQKKLEHLGQHN
jgi:predicted DNA-binding transcriptional regulator AlpA